MLYFGVLHMTARLALLLALPASAFGQTSPCDRAAALAELRDTGAALQTGREALKNLPANAPATEREALEAQQAPARTARKELLARCATDAVVIEALARGEYALGEAASALQLADHALALAEESGRAQAISKALVLRAEGLRLTGDYPKAAADAARAQALDPNNKDAFTLYQLTQGRQAAPEAGPGGGSALATAALETRKGPPTRQDFIVVLPGEGIPADQHPVLERLIRRAIGEVDKSPTGRQVLGELAEEAVRAGEWVRIYPKKYPDSAVIKQEGVERVSGIAGEADRRQLTYWFNIDFAGLRDSELAALTLKANIAHEFQHLIWGRKTAREFPSYRTALAYDFSDEEMARLKGYLVASESAGQRSTSYVEAAKAVVRNPQDFFYRLRLADPVYAVSLSPGEMAHPLESYGATLDRLKRRLAALTEDRDQGYPLLLRQIAHFEVVHGLRANLAELRLAIETEGKQIHSESRDVEESTRTVESMVRFLSSPKGAPLLAEFQTASADSRYRQFDALKASDIEKLRSIHAAQKLPRPVPTPGQIGESALARMIDRDKSDNPQHWKDGDEPN